VKLAGRSHKAGRDLVACLRATRRSEQSAIHRTTLTTVLLHLPYKGVTGPTNRMDVVHDCMSYRMHSAVSVDGTNYRAFPQPRFSPVARTRRSKRFACQGELSSINALDLGSTTS